MKLKPSSKAWIHEHINDEFVKRAQKDGYRARAAYKLTEIDDKDKLIKPGMIIVDLGATPGSWSQVVVQRLKGQGRVIALDLLEMQPINGVEFIQGDFREEAVLKLLEQSLNNKQVDLVIADMAPNMSGIADVDQAGAAGQNVAAFSLSWFIGVFVLLIPLALVTDRLMFTTYFYPAVPVVCLGIAWTAWKLWSVMGNDKKQRVIFLSLLVVYAISTLVIFYLMSPFGGHLLFGAHS